MGGGGVADTLKRSGPPGDFTVIKMDWTAGVTEKQVNASESIRR